MNADEITYLISPTEPPSLRAIGQVSSAVEKKGCDVLIVLPQFRIGVQRKTWVDLVISLDDGRLANSIPLMDMLHRIVIVEGKVLFDRAGHMVVRSNSKQAVKGWRQLRHTRESLQGVLYSLRYTHGLDVMKSDSLTETVMMIQRLGIYLSKDSHQGITGERSHGYAKDAWGVADAGKRKLARQVNFLMALGIGYKTSLNLLKHTEGKIPLSWTMSKEELMRVPLIGSSVADRLLSFLE